jgi:CrcB protein
MNNLLYIFIGGGLGSVCRYGISRLVLSVFSAKLPVGTLSANVLSCVVIGVVFSFYKEEIVSSNVLKPLILIGFCGGFSTFSTFSLETLELFKQGAVAWAIGNVFVSVIFCISILYLLVK